MRGQIANALTACGALCGVLGVALHNAPLVAASLGLDVLDGAAARSLAISSEAGARWDWTVDVALGAALAMALGWWWALPLQLAAQAVAIRTGRRVSGRATISACAIWTWGLV